MPYDGNEGEFILLPIAEIMTREYRLRHPQPGHVHAFYLGKNKLQQLIDQPGCVGIRVYKALEAVDSQQIVIVGVDCNEKDMTNGLILDQSFPCPANCDVGSSLNN